MRNISMVVGSTVFSVLTIGPLQDTCFSEEISEQIVTELAGKLVEDGTVDGLSVGFLQGDRYGTYHFGRATRSGARANNLTVYEIGSASKVFTSLLAADAVVRGQIKLSDPVDVASKARIVLPARGQHRITWLDLCTHRSGLPRLPGNIVATSMTNPYRTYDSSKAAEFLRQYQLTRAPGERQEYSNLAVSVLGYLVAEQAHSDYQTLLRQRIAQPLQMDDCTIDLNDSQRARLAIPHRPPGKEVPAWDFADLPGAGGIRATLRDMMRFARAQLYPPEGDLGDAIKLAWKQHHAADESGPATGLGWMILPDGETRWHNGETGGSHSILLINKQHRTAIIVLSNSAPGDQVDMLGIELIRRVTSPGTPRMAARSPDAASGGAPAERGIDRKRLEGRYQLAPNFVFDVQDVNGRMMVGITNQPTQEVFRDSDTKWSYRSVDATLEFHLRSRGPAYALTLHQNGIRQRAKRLRE